MRELGTIVRLQVQVLNLKVGQPPRKRYDPAGIRAVGRLSLSAEGVVGIADDGSSLDDIHNGTHPESKNRAGSNGISVGFVSHYNAMRLRHGDHLTDGIAGENILVQTNDASAIYPAAEFVGGLVIRTADGRILPIEDVIVAAPCVEFSRWAMRFPDDTPPDRTVTETLQFLHDGTRGFYCRYLGEPAMISVGDTVLLP